ncbi:MAG: hypothetical protein GYA23_07365 [Methanomicrobiales archaeon]|nr:hypothetical protein [Methanomicrobiales archaeon]
MRDFFKNLFGKKEPETVVISRDAVPGIIADMEFAARGTLSKETESPERAIRNAVAQLKLIVKTLANAEQDPEIHPKLKTIAKNTLPQFVRAMNSALEKDLPADTEEFYPAVVECVRNCLNSVKGPGRYLQIVFPDEMKASRAGIDTIGHEINAMTAALGTYRKQMAAIAHVRELYEKLCLAETDLGTAAEKDLRISRRVQEISDRIAVIGQELSSLSTDSGMAEAEQKKVELSDLEHQRDEILRTYAASSMTASHVFRKAEKIATRQKHAAEIGLLKHAMFLLSDHELPDADDLEKALAAACPVAERMIEAGEIPVKNKEERSVFSDTVSFCRAMRTTCADLHAREKACHVAREALASHPVLARGGSLEREKNQLSLMLEKEQHARTEICHWREKTQENIPLLSEELQKEVGEIMGKNVQFQEVQQKSV